MKLIIFLILVGIIMVKVQPSSAQIILQVKLKDTVLISRIKLTIKNLTNRNDTLGQRFKNGLGYFEVFTDGYNKGATVISYFLQPQF